jgi:hypothetical protein
MELGQSQSSFRKNKILDFSVQVKQLCALVEQCIFVLEFTRAPGLQLGTMAGKVLNRNLRKLPTGYLCVAGVHNMSRRTTKAICFLVKHSDILHALQACEDCFHLWPQRTYA